MLIISIGLQLFCHNSEMWLSHVSHEPCTYNGLLQNNIKRRFECIYMTNQRQCRDSSMSLHNLISQISLRGFLDGNSFFLTRDFKIKVQWVIGLMCVRNSTTCITINLRWKMYCGNHEKVNLGNRPVFDHLQQCVSCPHHLTAWCNHS